MANIVPSPRDGSVSLTTPARLLWPEGEVPSPGLLQAETLGTYSSVGSVVFPRAGLLTGILFQQMSKSPVGITLASSQWLGAAGQQDL